MAELYELPFFEDVLDWIKTLAKEDPESHLHVIATPERLQRWVRRCDVRQSVRSRGAATGTCESHARAAAQR
ncbi:hypothetical protein GCM10018771_02660 [Streptomyces cellulosae]|nr:hypothetical protein GCM10018771_02660 [Streptomyces cellulosae]